MKISLIAVHLLLALSTYGQNVGINDDGSDPHLSAMLDVKSTSKGILVPRLTTFERTSILAPATGLLVFDVETDSFWFKSTNEWIELVAEDRKPIVNADVSDEAAISGRKINPDFGKQDITTAGIISGDGSGLINLDLTTDEIVDEDGDTKVEVDSNNSDRDSIMFIVAGKDKLVLADGKSTFSTGLEVNTTSSAFSPPRVTTTEMENIADPQDGMMVMNIEAGCPYFYFQRKWRNVCKGFDGEYNISGENLVQASLNDFEGHEVDYLKKAGPSPSGRGNSLVALSDGSVVFTGSYRPSFTFGDTTLNALGGRDIFLAKYSPTGDFEWVRSMGSLKSDGGLGVARDAADNIYLTGYYDGEATFGDSTITTAGWEDAFVVKYSSAGDFEWVRSMGGNLRDRAQSVAVDFLGNIYLTGYWQQEAVFGNETLTTTGVRDIFLAKYSASGNFEWVRSAGGGSIQDTGYAVSSDGLGNVFMAGIYRAPANFGDTTLIGSGGDDIYVAKYSTAGNLIWTISAGGSAHDNVHDVALDGAGNCYLTGSSQSSDAFGDSLANGGSKIEFYVAKYDVDGNFEWVNSLQQISGTGGSGGYSLEVVGDKVYAAGSFFGVRKFDSKVLTSASPKTADVIILIVDRNSGEPIDALRGGGSSQEVGYGIVADASGNLYVYGSVSEGQAGGLPATFKDQSLDYSEPGRIFILKFKPE